MRCTSTVADAYDFGIVVENGEHDGIVRRADASLVDFTAVLPSDRSVSRRWRERWRERWNVCADDNDDVGAFYI